MASKQQSIWGIRAGKHGEADSLFLQHSYMAIGWPLGDLGKLPPDRNAFKQKYATHYPDASPPAVANGAGQVYRFVHEVKSGDLVIYPSKVDRLVHIGEVAGPYQYDPSSGEDFADRRKVKWLKHVPREQFSQGALYTLGAIQTLFQIENYADEFRAALQGTLRPTPPDKDPTVTLVGEDIEETTRDFIVKRLAQELKGHGFADFVAHLLSTMGYRTRVSPPGPDGGLDIIAHKDELGFEPPIIKVQVKSNAGSIGNDVVQALYGQVDKAEFGLVVTLGSFTPAAKNFARGKSNLRLIDSTELVDLIFEHYDDFDPRYKVLLPLKRVFVPLPPEE